VEDDCPDGLAVLACRPDVAGTGGLADDAALEGAQMSYNRIALSSGHGLHVRGACGILDEVEEARKVVDQVARELSFSGVEVHTFHDDISTSQNENLNRIVDFHNSQDRELDISIHFNAFEQCDEPRGTEVLYVTQAELADRMSSTIALAGTFIDRGPKKNTGLFFLNNTDKPAILLEICFVDSEADADLYELHFAWICTAIADLLAGNSTAVKPPPSQAGVTRLIGKCSWFGGPNDEGVDPDEGLAFIDSVNDAPHLFLPYQPQGTTGLARRLNPYTHYLAMRWDYDKTPKSELLNTVARVKNLATGVALQAIPADWGPNEATGRVADLSPSLMNDLGLATDDDVEIVHPYDGDGH
jgi:N-acetylmuramoyl-L-alanine amidase